MTRNVIVSLEIEATCEGDEFLAKYIAEAVSLWASQPDVQQGCQPERALILYHPEDAPTVRIATTAAWRKA
jgi:hypothetical protein